MNNNQKFNQILNSLVFPREVMAALIALKDILPHSGTIQNQYNERRADNAGKTL